MSRFKRLTDAEAGSLTRRELLDRVEAEQQYWFRKKKRTPEDDSAFREFTRIMYAYLGPDRIAEAMQDTIDYIEGRSTGGYWDMRPSEAPPKLPPMDDNQRAGLDYARRVFGIGDGARHGTAGELGMEQITDQISYCPGPGYCPVSGSYIVRSLEGEFVIATPYRDIADRWAASHRHYVAPWRRSKDDGTRHGTTGE